MLTINYIGCCNVFDWIECPLCGGREFESNDHAAVYCVACITRFVTSHTAGDPGVRIQAIVVDAQFDESWPFYKGVINPSFMQQFEKHFPKMVPVLEYLRANPSSGYGIDDRTRQVVRDHAALWSAWGQHFTLGRTLKIGEYDSGWSSSERGWIQKDRTDEAWFEWWEANKRHQSQPLAVS